MTRLLTAVSMFSLLACISDSITVIEAEDVDFDTICTYAIGGFPAQPGSTPDDLWDDVEVNIQTANQAAADELEKKGLVRAADVDSADVVITSAFASGTEEGTAWTCYPDYWWYGWPYGWDGCAWMEPYPVTVEVGHLLVTLNDETGQEVVFGGLIEGVASSEDIDSRVDKDVRALFKKFPGKAKDCE